MFDIAIGSDCMRLDFADKHSSVLYLRSSDCVEVSVEDLERQIEPEYQLIIDQPGRILSTYLLYSDKKTRDIDHKYLLDRLDEFFGVDKDEYSKEGTEDETE